MKKVLATLLLGTMVVSPAFARTPVRHYQAPATQSDRWEDSYGYDIGEDSYARVPSATETDPIGRNSVYTDGEYRGTDPDPQIRLDLRRESPHGGD